MFFYGSRRAKFSAKLKIVRKRASRMSLRKLAFPQQFRPNAFGLDTAPIPLAAVRTYDLCRVSDIGTRIFTQDFLMMRFYAPSAGDRAFDALLLNQQRLNAVQI
jgi:hypothetical protein